MSGNSRQNSQNVEKVSVKLEPREFCTESTEKVSKLKVEVGGSCSGTKFPAREVKENGESLTRVCKKIYENACTISPTPVAVVNNDACKLMDFCTNIRVDANVGLGLGSDRGSDSESRDTDSSMSDVTEYESAEQMALAGAPLPTSLTLHLMAGNSDEHNQSSSTSTTVKPLGTPKTPGAKWSRHTYVSTGLGPPVPIEKAQYLEKCEPGRSLKSKQIEQPPDNLQTNKDDYNLPEKSCVKFKKILPKVVPASVATLELASSSTNAISDSESETSNVITTVTDTDTVSSKSVATPALELAKFCTNIKVESNGTVSERNSSESPAQIQGASLNSPPSMPGIQTARSTTSLSQAFSTDITLSSTPTLLTSATQNIVSLPRPPNKFQYHWMNVYHWLEYDTEKHSMFCNMCKKLKKMNPFATQRGCTNFKTCTLKRHEESKEHKEAIIHYAKNNQVMVVDHQTVISKPNISSGILGPESRVIGGVTHFRLGGFQTPKIADQKGQKRDAQGKVIDPLQKSLSVNNVQVGKNMSGMQFKIVPQTITTSTGGAPVMIHKLVPTNQTAADPQQRQPRNYNGFRMAYYIAKEQLPVKSVENIIALVDYPPYQNWKESVREQMFNDMHFCIATTLWKAIEFELRKVNFISLTLEDGGKDTQGGFHWLLVSVKYVYQSKVYSYFVHLDKLHEMSVEELLLIVVEWLLKNQIPFLKLVGLEVGSDKDGLITHLLPQVIHELSRQGCKLISVHTIGNPQLSVAVAEVGQRIPALQRYNDFLGLLFDYFDNATDRTIEIPLLREHLNEQMEEVINYSSILWLSRAGTIKVIYLTWAALVEALQAEDDDEAHDLLKIIKQYTFIALTHFLMDILPSIHALDEIIKQEPWNTPSIRSAVDYTIASVEALQDHLGAHEQQFFAQFDETSGSFASIPLLNHQAQQQEVADVRNEFLQVFLIELQGRYPRGLNSSARDAFHVLHPKVLRDINDTTTLGLPQMSTISQVLGVSSTSDGREEFQWILDQARSHSTTDSVTEFCQELLTVINTPQTASCIMNVMKVIECLLVLPGHHIKVTSDHNKSVNSLEGLLKMDIGKSITHSRQVTSRLCIMMNGPPIDKFNFETAYVQWLKNIKDRALGTVKQKESVI